MEDGCLEMIIRMRVFIFVCSVSVFVKIDKGSLFLFSFFFVSSFPGDPKEEPCYY